MSAESRKLFQIVLAVALVAAGVRLAFIYRARHSGGVAQTPRQEGLLNADYYVTPKKLYAYDLKSAGELTRQPVWVREGYKYTYYPFNPRTRHADFVHEAGTLGPIEKLQVTAVVLDPSPAAPLKPGQVRVKSNEHQVLAVFQKDGRDYAVPFGVENTGDYHIYADEIFYIQDPRELYKHWPREVWDAIAQRQVKPGMNELQATFAIGVGIPQPENGSTKVVTYPNGGEPVQITYQNGRATEIKRQKS